VDTRIPQISLTVSLTATFSPLAGVGFRFSSIPGISFKWLKIDDLGNYCSIHLSYGAACKINDLTDGNTQIVKFQWVEKALHKR
jgi:hypothetical protein